MTTPFLYTPTYTPLVNGQIVPGGLLYTYQAGTTTPKPTFADAAGISPNPNPVILNAVGSATIRLEPGAYHFVLKDPSGTTTLDDQDFYNAPYLTQADIGNLLYGAPAIEQAVGAVVVNSQFQVGDVRRYGADPAAVDNQSAINQAIAVLNAGGGPLIVSGGPYISSALATITADDAEVRFTTGASIQAAVNTWGQSGDGTTFWLITGKRARLTGVTLDGNQAAWAAGNWVGRLLQPGDEGHYISCTFKNSPYAGMRAGATGGTFVDCRFEGNANLGAELNVCADLKFTNCSFTKNGYGFHGVYSATGPVGVAFGAALRFRSHHNTFVGCRFIQNGLDGITIGQGSYANKLIGCAATNNNDGGFTLNNNFTAGGAVAGDGEFPYDNEYLGCEAFNNWGSGLVSYSKALNIQVVGGRYANNNRAAGNLADIGGNAPSSSVNGIYFAPGSQGIHVRAKCYDDRQMCVVTANSAGTLTATGWIAGYMAAYPKVAIYNFASTTPFQGYATIVSESSGTLTISGGLPHNGATVSSIVSGWYVTQRTQHNGCFLDNSCQGELDIDGFGELPGPQPYFGWAEMSGYNDNAQNITLLGATTHGTELLANPSFESDVTNWTFSTAGGGAANPYSTAGVNLRSAGALQLIAGTSLANGDATLAASGINYVQNAFVEFSMWVSAAAPSDASIALFWNPGGGASFGSTVNHPGGGYKFLRVGAFIPAGVTSLLARVTSAIGKTNYFDNGNLRVKTKGRDNREVGYPIRTPAL